MATAGAAAGAGASIAATNGVTSAIGRAVLRCEGVTAFGSMFTISCGRSVPTMVSWPPFEVKTIRCADESAEMSTVSLPVLPSMVMVLKLRLVWLKSPTTEMLSPDTVPPLAPPGEVTRSVLTMISSILSSSDITVPLRVITISVLALSVRPVRAVSAAARV